MISAAEALLERAVGWRQGVVSQLHPVPHSLSDVDEPGWAAVPEPFSAGGTSGGTTRVAAVAEALERYAAARSPLPPHEGTRWELAEFVLHERYLKADQPYTTAWTLPHNDPIGVPAGLVGLDPGYGLPSTSSGLAAGPSTTNALLRATQELVERDAFTTAWLKSLAPHRIQADLPDGATAFDLTPDYSPHPVVAVAGSLPLAGRPRPTLGLACRATTEEAIGKAYQEWLQGTVFIEVWLAQNPATTYGPHEVTDFDKHAVYYAGHPDQWDALPWWNGPAGARPPDSAAKTGRDQLHELAHALHGNGIRLAYRELTTPELAAVGLRAVRVLSPDLTPLHADHRWPHLPGPTNPAPHPLG